MGLPDALLFRTLWDIAAMEKRWGARMPRWPWSRNWRDRAIRTACARSKSWPSTTSTASANYAMALEMTLAALGIGESAPLRRREARLRKRIGRMERLPGT